MAEFWTSWMSICLASTWQCSNFYFNHCIFKRLYQIQKNALLSSLWEFTSAIIMESSAGVYGDSGIRVVYLVPGEGIHGVELRGGSARLGDAQCPWWLARKTGRSLCTVLEFAYLLDLLTLCGAGVTVSKKSFVSVLSNILSPWQALHPDSPLVSPGSLTCGYLFLVALVLTWGLKPRDLRQWVAFCVRFRKSHVVFHDHLTTHVRTQGLLEQWNRTAWLKTTDISPCGAGA